MVAYEGMGTGDHEGRPYGEIDERVMPPSLEAMIGSPLGGER